ncbi:MAG: RagB/SusD family nutrient uptake outer membrane protein [Tannerella sp.]|nr:RagB/SusD family nutrient uptake outer membrane protein [Tannerella sp.]
MKNLKIVSLIAFIGLFAISCNDFLDEMPDNRTEIGSKEQVRQLLVSAYPNTCYYAMTEFSSDNADESSGVGWDAEPIQEQIYKWGDITDIEYDSPHWVWQSFYRAVAAANAALEAIEKLDDPKTADAQKAEALLCRAYSEFVLVNLFSKPYGITSEQDMGVPYPLVPETTVRPQYDRLTVARVYELIERDVEEALPLVDDTSYPTALKYHFTHDAAYAFAARFNLYYRKYNKVITYAGEVLGNDPVSRLRDWAAGGRLSNNGNLRPDWFISPENQATLLLTSANTNWGAMHGPYLYCTRYGHNRNLNVTETMESPTPWGEMVRITRYSTFWNEAVNRIIVRKMGYYFEYSDPVAGIGEPYSMLPAFTTDETLLCRAEAYILTQEYDKAVADMNMFMQAFTTGAPVTRQTIVDFYENTAYYTSEEPTVKKKLNPDFSIAEGSEEENLIHGVLHLRRMLTIHEGLRWFDIRRYGIEITRRIVNNNKFTQTDVLRKDDNRRTFQLPAAVIAAGLPKNPR